MNEPVKDKEGGSRSPQIRPLPQAPSPGPAREALDLGGDSPVREEEEEDVHDQVLQEPSRTSPFWVMVPGLAPSWRRRRPHWVLTDE